MLVTRLNRGIQLFKSLGRKKILYYFDQYHCYYNYVMQNPDNIMAAILEPYVFMKSKLSVTMFSRGSCK